MDSYADLQTQSTATFNRLPDMNVKQEPAKDQGVNTTAHAQLTTNGAAFLVQVPQLGEGIEETLQKVQDLANAVADGGVLAFQAHASAPSPEVEGYAKKMMTDTERCQYEEWKARRLMPPSFDWTANKISVPYQGLEAFTQRAAAMDIIWRREGTLPANAVWLSNNMGDLLPLVKAVEKVFKAQAYFEKQGGCGGTTASEMAELETLREINATIDANVTRMMSQIEAILDSAETLKWRQKALERSLPLS